MKHKIIISSLILSFFAFSGCKKNYEEFYFSGKVVGAQICSSTQLSYMIDITYPEGLGDTITTSYGKFQHAVMAYHPPRRMTENEVVYGVAYRTKDWGKLNCVGLFNYTLPEIVLLGVDEDPSVIENSSKKH